MQIHQGCRRGTSNKGSHKQTGNFTKREIFKTYFPLGFHHRQKLTFKMHVWLREKEAERKKDREGKGKKGVEIILGLTCCTFPSNLSVGFMCKLLYFFRYKNEVTMY